MSGYDLQTRRDLYKNYCRELEEYDESGNIYPDSQAYYVANTYMTDSRFQWKDIYFNDEIVGFLITSEKHPFMEGFVISEAYIKPEYRNKGLMTNLIKEVLSNINGMVSMEIFRKNKVAISFWKNRMEENWFVLEGKSICTEEGLEEYVFSKQ